MTISDRISTERSSGNWSHPFGVVPVVNWDLRASLRNVVSTKVGQDVDYRNSRPSGTPLLRTLNKLVNLL